MKVLYITATNLFVANNAGSNRVRGLLEAISNSVDVEVIHVNVSSSSLDKERFGNINFIPIRHGFKLLRYLPTSVQHEWLSFFISKVSQKEVLSRVLDFRPDIVWFDYSIPAQKILVNSGIMKAGGSSFIELSEFLDIHRVQKTNRIRSFLADLKLTYFKEKAIIRYDGIALMTKTLLEYFQEELVNNRQKLLHLPMTVDLDRFEKKKDEPPKGFKSPYIAFVGVMNNIKDGVDVLISAFSQISEEFPKYNLYLVGPWQPDTLGHLNQIKSLGLESKVKWMKTYPREEIPSILMNAELLVLPRPDSKQAQGGFPTKLGEYLATGKPVCATRVGEIPDYLTDGESVFFAEPGSVDSFADAMRRALQNPEEATRVGQNGRKVAEKEFNAAIQAEKLKVFFEQLVNSKEE